jgi:CubicO group peptidase (beta-lactamase class C family)
LFEPLGMLDTAFSWPAGAGNRVATAYAPGEDGRPVVFDRPDGYWSSPPLFPNAAGWLVSTLHDFWAFVQLLRNGGVFDDHRLLSEGSLSP